MPSELKVEVRYVAMIMSIDCMRFKTNAKKLKNTSIKMFTSCRSELLPSAITRLLCWSVELGCLGRESEHDSQEDLCDCWGTPAMAGLLLCCRMCGV